MRFPMFSYPFIWRGFVVIEHLVILPGHIDTCMYWQAVQLNPLFRWDINRFSLQKGYTDWSIKYIRKLDHYDVCFTSLNTAYLQRTLLEL